MSVIAAQLQELQRIRGLLDKKGSSPLLELGSAPELEAALMTCQLCSTPCANNGQWESTKNFIETSIQHYLQHQSAICQKDNESDDSLVLDWYNYYMAKRPVSTSKSAATIDPATTGAASRTATIAETAVATATIAERATLAAGKIGLAKPTAATKAETPAATSTIAETTAVSIPTSNSSANFLSANMTLIDESVISHSRLSSNCSSGVASPTPTGKNLAASPDFPSSIPYQQELRKITSPPGVTSDPAQAGRPRSSSLVKPRSSIIDQIIETTVRSASANSELASVWKDSHDLSLPRLDAFKHSIKPREAFQIKLEPLDLGSKSSANDLDTNRKVNRCVVMNHYSSGSSAPGCGGLRLAEMLLNDNDVNKAIKIRSSYPNEAVLSSKSSIPCIKVPLNEASDEATTRLLELPLTKPLNLTESRENRAISHLGTFPFRCQELITTAADSSKLSGNKLQILTNVETSRHVEDRDTTFCAKQNMRNCSATESDSISGQAPASSRNFQRDHTLKSNTANIRRENSPTVSSEALCLSSKLTYKHKRFGTICTGGNDSSDSKNVGAGASEYNAISSNVNNRLEGQASPAINYANDSYSGTGGSNAAHELTMEIHRQINAGGSLDQLASVALAIDRNRHLINSEADLNNVKVAAGIPYSETAKSIGDSRKVSPGLRQAFSQHQRLSETQPYKCLDLSSVARNCPGIVRDNSTSSIDFAACRMSSPSDLEIELKAAIINSTSYSRTFSSGGRTSGLDVNSAASAGVSEGRRSVDYVHSASSSPGGTSSCVRKCAEVKPFVERYRFMQEFLNERIPSLLFESKQEEIAKKLQTEGNSVPTTVDEFKIFSSSIFRPNKASASESKPQKSPDDGERMKCDVKPSNTSSFHGRFMNANGPDSRGEACTVARLFSVPCSSCNNKLRGSSSTSNCQRFDCNKMLRVLASKYVEQKPEENTSKGKRKSRSNDDRIDNMKKIKLDRGKIATIAELYDASIENILKSKCFERTQSIQNNPTSGEAMEEELASDGANSLSSSADCIGGNSWSRPGLSPASISTVADVEKSSITSENDVSHDSVDVGIQCDLLASCSNCAATESATSTHHIPVNSRFTTTNSIYNSNCKSVSTYNIRSLMLSNPNDRLEQNTTANNFDPNAIVSNQMLHPVISKYHGVGMYSTSCLATPNSQALILGNKVKETGPIDRRYIRENPIDHSLSRERCTASGALNLCGSESKIVSNIQASSNSENLILVPRTYDSSSDFTNIDFSRPSSIISQNDDIIPESSLSLNSMAALLRSSISSDSENYNDAVSQFEPCSSAGDKAVSQCEPLNLEYSNSSSRRCEPCGIKFDDEALHKIHMSCHNLQDPFACSRCGIQYSTRNDFYIHINRCHQVV